MALRIFCDNLDICLTGEDLGTIKHVLHHNLVSLEFFWTSVHASEIVIPCLGSDLCAFNFTK